MVKFPCMVVKVTPALLCISEMKWSRAEYSPKVKQMNGTAQIVEAIKQDPNGVGYVGLGYVIDSEGDLERRNTSTCYKFY